MMLLDGITLHSFDTNRWVVHTQQERNFLVNGATYQLITLLRESTNINEALKNFNVSFQTDFTEEQFKSLVSEKLGGPIVAASFVPLILTVMICAVPSTLSTEMLSV